jgi:hypothetical protein
MLVWTNYLNNQLASTVLEISCYYRKAVHQASQSAEA